jgi:hypothetical protein
VAQVVEKQLCNFRALNSNSRLIKKREREREGERERDRDKNRKERQRLNNYISTIWIIQKKWMNS